MLLLALAVHLRKREFVASLLKSPSQVLALLFVAQSPLQNGLELLVVM